jgi:hypothetical protein
MEDVPSVEQLIEQVHRYYPANRWEGDAGYVDTPEYQRLGAARRMAWERGRERWRAFLARVRETLPGGEVEDWTLLQSDNCWRVRVHLPGTVVMEDGSEEFRAVVGLVSILAPVAALYTSFKQRLPEHLRGDGRVWRASRTFYEPIPEARDWEQGLERVLRSDLEVARLPNETLFTPVPDIQCFNVALGKARLIDCLFTDDRW